MAIVPSDLHRKIQLGGTARSPDEVISLHRLGLRFAEITITNPAEFLLVQDRYRALSKVTGFFYLGHGPREGDPNDMDTLETVYFPKLLEILSLMPDLAMPVLTLHLWLDPRFVREETIVYKIGFLKRLTERAQASGIAVCLENLSEHAAHLADVLAAVPALNLTLDLGHAELLAKENTSFGFLEKFPDRIKHLHLHDNHGGSSPKDDLHLPVGEGRIDFRNIFEKLHAAGYRGTMTLELRPDQIARCLEYVNDLIDPER